jgi:hypothetical protein
MGTIAWQYGQVGKRNSTTLGRGAARTSPSKLPESRTTTLEGAAGLRMGVVGLDPPPPHPPASSATTAAVSLRLTP